MRKKIIATPFDSPYQAHSARIDKAFICPFAGWTRDLLVVFPTACFALRHSLHQNDILAADDASCPCKVEQLVGL
jgi:hypothetical protein